GMVFERALAARPRALARLAPAVERPGIHLGVWREDGELRVWGATRSIPMLTFVVEVVEPGLLVLKHRRGDEYEKYGTVAVLAGDRIEVVDESGASLPDCPPLLTHLLGFDPAVPADGSVNVLIQLAVSMRAHGRGGSLLVVPEGSAEWRESAAQPIPYLVQPFSGLTDLLAADAEARQRPEWREWLHRAVDAVAGLTAVDGATVINTRHELLAFGVKLGRRRGSERVERVALTAPVVGNEAAV